MPFPKFGKRSGLRDQGATLSTTEARVTGPTGYVRLATEKFRQELEIIDD